MSKLGFGVIGCGRISEAHLQALDKRPDAQFICGADINAEVAQKQAEKHGAKHWVTDYHELLSMPEVDAVVVCVPTFLHAEVVCAAAEAGKHVLCEKPIAMKLEDARRMTDTCRTAGVRFMVGFVRQFSTEWMKMREIVQSGRIGRPVLWRHTTAIRKPPLRWFIDREKGGGPFIDGSVHDYDFARSMFGDAEWALGSLMRFSEDTTALDTGSAIIHFASGDELVRSHSWCMPGPNGNVPTTQDVIGPGGAIRFPNASEAGSLFIINGDGSEEAVPFEPTTGQDWFDHQMAHFISSVQDGTEPLSTGERGVEALKIALAVLQAGESHELVRV